jgi:hypothetical protein
MAGGIKGGGTGGGAVASVTGDAVLSAGKPGSGWTSPAGMLGSEATGGCADVTEGVGAGLTIVRGSVNADASEVATAGISPRFRSMG